MEWLGQDCKAGDKGIAFPGATRSMPALDVLKTQTVRFASVVEAAGKPVPYTLWTDPARDSEFQKALREQRVMTVLRRRSKPDAALVGYSKKDNALYLVFAKTLQRFRDRRIVGLKYDLLTEPKPKGKPVRFQRGKSAARGPAPAKPVKAAALERKMAEKPVAMPKGDALIRFRVKARMLVALDREVDVEAKNRHQARDHALKILKEQPVNFSARPTEIRIKKISRNPIRR